MKCDYCEKESTYGGGLVGVSKLTACDDHVQLMLSKQDSQVAIERSKLASMLFGRSWITPAQGKILESLKKEERIVIIRPRMLGWSRFIAFVKDMGYPQQNGVK